MGIARIGLITTAGVAVGGIVGALVGIEGAEDLISDFGENINNLTEIYADIYENMNVEPQEFVEMLHRIEEADAEFYEEVKNIISQAQFGLLDNAQIVEGLPPIPQTIIDSANISDDYIASYNALSDNLSMINNAGTPLGQNSVELIEEISKPISIGAAGTGSVAMAIASATDLSSSWKDRITSEQSNQQRRH